MYKYIFILLISLPQISLASVYISEIFYDAPSGDTGREWIEIHNNSGSDVDLSSFKFNESDKNHKINPVAEGNSPILSSGKYAVVADNPTLFMEDNKNFSGVLFDSSFSLKNTGEQLILKDSEGNDLDSLFYDTSIGGGGDGNSLQKNNGVWTSAVPTPGKAYSYGSALETVGVDTNNNQDNSNLNSIDYVKRGSIEAYGGKDKTALAGSFVEFRGSALGLQKEPLDKARYLWSFGDGSMGEGQRIFHTYAYPGKYKVSLDVSSLDYTDSDFLVVDILEPEINISDVNTILEGESFIELENLSDTDIDIGLWILKYDNQTYVFPKNTFMIKKSKIKVPFSITSLAVKDKNKVALFYPSGKILSFYKDKKVGDLKKQNEVHKIIASNINIIDIKNKLDENNKLKKDDISLTKKLNLKERDKQSARVYSSGYKVNYWLLIFTFFLVFILIFIFFSKKFIKEKSDSGIIDINDFSAK